MPSKRPNRGMNFVSMRQVDVPQGRKGKHRDVVEKILADLDRVEPGAALKIPIDELPAGKEHVRSALNRASHKAKRRVQTASDDEFLYIWNDER